MVNYKEDIDRICRQIADLYKKQLIEDGAVASGRLRDSVDNFTYSFDNESFTLYFNLEDYWKYAPEGIYNTSNTIKMKYIPKKMVESIRQWISDKGLDLNEYAVSRNIMKEGWKRQPRENLDKVMRSFDFEILVDELETVIFHMMYDEIMEKMLDNL